MAPLSWSPLSWAPQSWSPQSSSPQSSSPSRGLEPTPDQARGWLRDELFGPSYQDSWLDSVIRWILEHLQTVSDGVSRATNTGISPVITVLVALVVIALLVWVLPKVRRESALRRSSGAVLDDLAITPGAYRRLASVALAEGRFDDAVLNGFRAIARDMSDRTLLDDAPGRTAHEVSLALGSPFPEHADRLGQAANIFDAVRYGSRHATDEQASLIQQLDAELVRTRPKLTTSQPMQDLPV